MTSLELQLQDYRLTTAEILYHLPDHPMLLQSYIWQEYDLAPRFPELKRFWISGRVKLRENCILSWWHIKS